MVPSDKRLKIYKNGYDCQFAVIYRGSEVLGTCFLDVRLWEVDSETNPWWHSGSDDTSNTPWRLYLDWEAVGEFPCTRVVSSNDDLRVDIFTVFQNMFTFKYTTSFNPQNRGGTNFTDDYAFVQESLNWGGVSIEMDGTTCIVKYNVDEFVEDLYDRFNLYANGHESEEFFDTFENNGDAIFELLELFVETEKLNKKRGWGKTRRWILDTIMNCTPILMSVTVPDFLYPGERMTVTSPSGQNLVVVVPLYRLRGDRFTVLVPR